MFPLWQAAPLPTFVHTPAYGSDSDKENEFEGEGSPGGFDDDGYYEHDFDDADLLPYSDQDIDPADDRLAPADDRLSALARVASDAAGEDSF